VNQNAYSDSSKKIKTNTKKMKVQTIFGENGKLSQLCGNGQCPAAIISDNDEIIVQGYLLASGESSVLTAPAGEGFVRMKRKTFEAISRHVLAS
jgi:hypothetical protein